MGRKPALQVEAAQIVAGLVAAEKGFRRVASRAMPRTLHQISAAIPSRRLLGVGLEFAFSEIQRIPGPHRQTDVERERQRVRFDRLVYRLDGREISADRQNVVTGHLGVGGKRHRGVEPTAVRPHTLAYGVVELLIAPGADTGFVVGSNIRRGDDAERSFDRTAAGKWLSAIQTGMTGKEVCDR